MAFQGYLLKFGGIEIPHKYIQLESYSTTPDQRTELSAHRDNNNTLHRVTSPNHKTTIKFNTIPLNLTQKIELQTAMKKGLINEVERKYQVTYWNDEKNVYETGDFYMPDVDYSIRNIKGNNIEYSSIAFELIEY